MELPFWQVGWIPTDNDRHIRCAFMFNPVLKQYWPAYLPDPPTLWEWVVWHCVKKWYWRWFNYLHKKCQDSMIRAYEGGKNGHNE